MQINKILCIIHKFVKIVYGKTTYEDMIAKLDFLIKHERQTLF